MKTDVKKDTAKPKGTASVSPPGGAKKEVLPAKAPSSQKVTTATTTTKKSDPSDEIRGRSKEIRVNLNEEIQKMITEENDDKDDHDLTEDQKRDRELIKKLGADVSFDK